MSQSKLLEKAGGANNGPQLGIGGTSITMIPSRQALASSQSSKEPMGDLQ